MILQALKEYYDRKFLDPESGIAPKVGEKKEIPFIIVINKEGHFVQIEDTREGEGKKKKSRSFLVPQGVKKSSGIAANLLWDNVTYIFGIGANIKQERALEQKKAFMTRLEKELNSVSSIKPLLYFLSEIPLERLQKESLWSEILDSQTAPNLSFRFVEDQELICQRIDVREALSASQENLSQQKEICLVTASEDIISRLHPSIKGVHGAQTAGANIISFNLDSFVSYNKKQGHNAPVGQKTVFAYTTAINTLLSRDSRQRMQVGDTSTIFWSQKSTIFENDFSAFFSEPPKDDPDANTKHISSLFNSVENGSYYDNAEEDLHFYVLGLAPNAARIAIRFWKCGTVAEIANNIKQYFEDFSIQKPPTEPQYYSLWRILVNIAQQDKSENISPNIAGEFMRSILHDTPYPATLLQAALRRIRSDSEYRVKPVRAAVIKAYLNRYYRTYFNPTYKEITMGLDPSQPSVGYQLGRLFASLEKIQEEGNPNLNVTIRERFYGAASANPVTVFATLLKLKNHHLAKMESRGRVINLERLLSEILSNINAFPACLNLHEQGFFAIGYYHQRQAFFTKKDSHNTATN